jgi:hypothetical protein
MASAGRTLKTGPLIALKFLNRNMIKNLRPKLTTDKDNR